jgi:hypothetical protein
VIYTVTPWLNVSPHAMFSGYRPSDFVATAPDLKLRVDGNAPEHAAGKTFAIGNRHGSDLDDRFWPADVRSVSVGDVLTIEWWSAEGPSRVEHFAVERLGFKVVDKPTRRVPLNGTPATSREVSDT